MKYLKFEFTDRADMLTKLADYITTNEEGAVYLKDCNVVENVRLSIPNPKYSVDVIFHSTFPTLAEEVTPSPMGGHTILGMQPLYQERYNEVNGVA